MSIFDSLETEVHHCTACALVARFNAISPGFAHLEHSSNGEGGVVVLGGKAPFMDKTAEWCVPPSWDREVPTFWCAAVCRTAGSLGLPREMSALAETWKP